MAASKRGRPATPTKVDNRRSKILKVLESADLGTTGDTTPSEPILEDAKPSASNEDALDGSSTAATLEGITPRGIDGSPDAVNEDALDLSSAPAVDQDGRSDSPDNVFNQVVG
jgi:hypothetical protein